jgi:uncharacterized MnhB-related membrane protein
MNIEPFFLIILVALAVFSILAPNLKCGIIGISAFGVWISFVFLFYHAPDVALAEAAIASSLGTILFIITIKNYVDISVKPTKKGFYRFISYDILIISSCVLVLFLTRQTEIIGNAQLFYEVINDFQVNGARVYPVSAILLDYRLFDTLFEALILLISGLAVAHLIKHLRKGDKNEKQR